MPIQAGAPVAHYAVRTTLASYSKWVD